MLSDHIHGKVLEVLRYEIEEIPVSLGHGQNREKTFHVWHLRKGLGSGNLPLGAFCVSSESHLEPSFQKLHLDC